MGSFEVHVLHQVDDYEFEYLIAELWQSRGFETTVRPQSRDGGVDVVGEKYDPYPQKVVIQAKRYAPGNNVSSTEIQQYASLRLQEDADEVVVVTTSDFSSPARQLAESLNVKIVDGNTLQGMLAKSGLRPGDTHVPPTQGSPSDRQLGRRKKRTTNPPDGDSVAYTASSPLPATVEQWITILVVISFGGLIVWFMVQFILISLGST